MSWEVTFAFQFGASTRANVTRVHQGLNKETLYYRVFSYFLYMCAGLIQLLLIVYVFMYFGYSGVSHWSTENKEDTFL